MKDKDNRLLGILDFVQFTHKVQQVRRTIYVTGEDRDENDAEHSFQLAMLAWYIATSTDLKLDENKIIKYALAHDLVEVYAGDTYFYTTDKSLKDSKKKREKDAAKQIKKEFPEFGQMHQIINDYESLSDPEAKFIYALDKILPAINVFLDQGRSWQRDKVTYEMLRTKDIKVAVSQETLTIWEEFIVLLEKNKDLFG
ncbi:MAG: HD domain-containing protein [Patescibacteria group bacterium]|nr:HD domain-containing protein [Patescibacteria group bacterium]